MMTHHSLKRQQGVALVTALLITAMATVIAVSLMSRQYVDVARTGNMMAADQTYLYGLAVETTALELLGLYIQNNAYDDPDGEMYKPYVFEQEGAMVNGQLSDLEGRFNLNSLVKPGGSGEWVLNPDQRERFVRLLDNVMQQLQFSGVSADDLANAVVDWLDTDSQATMGGAEDGDYMSLADVQYRAANRLMTSASELNMVMGFDRELLYGKTINDQFEPGLLRYVAALPQTDTTININTADKKVIKAMSSYFTDAAVDALVAHRGDPAVAPFKDTGEFTGHQAITDILEDLKKKNDDKGQKAFEKDYATGWDVKSHYYLVTTHAQLGKTTTVLNSLLYRDAKANANRLVALSRSMGTDGI
ncbi:MAG: type II secretion system minor pseudopilin GspK [Gammaproteobacteria bacterium]|nr:type II secretion system minor pseudopilin GspK [Gammaproteobacteria bacterium]